MAQRDVLHEARQAQPLIDRFIEEADQRGIAAMPLQARLLDGHQVKTDKRGWYLKSDQSVAIGEDGGYYLLTVPGGWRERLRGVRLEASPAPLMVSRGGRDGETGSLSFFLQKRLEAG